MDINLCSKLQLASANHRNYTSQFKNADGNVAQPGDLLVEGDNFNVCVKDLFSKVNEDSSRRFNICSRYGSTSQNEELREDETAKDACVVIGTVVGACRGNGKRMRSGKIKNEPLNSVINAEDESDYLFEDVQSIHLLNMLQIQQLRRIGQDHTSIFFWAHFQRISASKIHHARQSAKSMLCRVNVDEILPSGKKLADSLSLSLCIYIYIYIYMCVCVCICMCVYKCVNMYVNVRMFIYLRMCMYVVNLH